MSHCVIPSPFGPIQLSSEGGAITEITFIKSGEFVPPHEATLVEAARQLDAYFAGTRTSFNLTLAPAGTAFQISVWRKLQEIPYGQTRTYSELARLIGNRNASRAVGLANSKNPIAIVIPCHRVIGASGHLVGYAGGIEIKRALLDLELAHSFTLSA